MAYASWLTLLLPALVAGHGMMTKPVSRNGNTNSLAAGGPSSVHGGGYTHGICGNSKGGAQTYNKVGPVKATYTEGSEIQVELTITAHHMGLFEFDLCTDAGQLSEECFQENRLLLAGCNCDCQDGSKACEACDKCRHYWKAWMPDESLWPENKDTYNSPAGVRPLMEGHYLTTAKYIVKLVIPEGTKTRNGVLRWHWMSTNSCSGSYSQPEEFWNCADIAIRDRSGSLGPSLSYDNQVLESTKPRNLMPDITARRLTGLVSACPIDHNGKMQLFGPPERYHCGKQCTGNKAGGSYAYCYVGSPRCNDDTPTPGTTTAKPRPTWKPTTKPATTTKKTTTKPATTTKKTTTKPTTTKKTTTTKSTTTKVFSTQPPPTFPPTDKCEDGPGITCFQQCSEWFFKCILGNSALENTQAGQICKDNMIVPATECYPGGVPGPTCIDSCWMSVPDARDKLCAEIPGCSECPFCGTTTTTTKEQPVEPDEVTCKRVVGNNQGCTDTSCAKCADGYQWWPCNEKPACCECTGPVELKEVLIPSCGDCKGCLTEAGQCFESAKGYCDSMVDHHWCGGAEVMKKVDRFLPIYDELGQANLIPDSGTTWHVAEGYKTLVYYTQPALGSHIDRYFDETAEPGSTVVGEMVGDSWLKVTIDSPNTDRIDDGSDDKLFAKCGITTLDFVLAKKSSKAKYEKCVKFHILGFDDSSTPKLGTSGPTLFLALASAAGVLLMSGAVMAWRWQRRPARSAIRDEESVSLTEPL